MPVRRKYAYRRKPRKTTYRRRYKRRNNRILKTPGPPAAMFAKINFADYRAVNVSFTSTDVRSYSLNSCYDPDFSGVGIQPLFFDQYMAMYNNFVVYAAKIRVMVSCGTPSNNAFHPIFVAVPSPNGTPTYGDVRTVMQIRGAKYTTIVPTSGPKTINMYIKLAKFFGIPKEAIRTDDNYYGNASAGPPIQYYLHLYFQNIDGTSVMPCTRDLKITYYVKFFNLKDVASS